MYHLTALEPPFYGENLITLGYNIVHKYPKPIGNKYSPRLSNFIFKLLDKTPNNRPKISDVYQYFPPNFQPSRAKPLPNETIASKTQLEHKYINEFPMEPERSNDKLLSQNVTFKGDQMNQDVGIKDNCSRKKKNEQEQESIEIDNKILADEEAVPNMKSRASFEQITLQKQRTLNKFTIRNLDGISQPVQNKDKDFKPKLSRNRSHQQFPNAKLNEINTSNGQVKDYSFVERLQQKISENETTVESKVKMATTGSDLQDNESTLSVKKFDQTIHQNYYTKEDRDQKQALNRRFNATTLEDDCQSPTTEENLNRTVKKQGYGFQAGKRESTKDISCDPVEEEDNTNSLQQQNSTNKFYQTMKTAAISDFKKIMLNPLIKSSAPSASLTSTKFADIISLRNQATTGVTKENETIRQTSARNGQQDNWLRPISVQVIKRSVWESDRKPLEMTRENSREVTARSGVNVLENVVAVAIKSDKNSEDTQNKNNSLPTMNANFVPFKKDSINETNQIVETQNQNIRLRDLLKGSSGLRNNVDLHSIIGKQDTLFDGDKGDQLNSGSKAAFLRSVKLDSIQQNTNIMSKIEQEKLPFYGKNKCKIFFAKNKFLFNYLCISSTIITKGGYEHYCSAIRENTKKSRCDAMFIISHSGNRELQAQKT